MQFRFGAKSDFIILAMLATAVCLSAPSASATTVTLTASFDGLPVIDSLPDYQYAVIGAYRPSTGTRITTEGMLVDGAIAIDLEPDVYNISLVVGATPFNGRTAAAPGDLRVSRPGIDVPSSGPFEVPVTLFYAVHLTSPYDNGEPWNGNTLSCPSGPPVSPGFTLTWDPVPKVTSYRVQVSHRTCDELVESVFIETTETTIEVTINPMTGSELYIKIDGISDRGNQVVTTPRMVYLDAQNDSMELHFTETSTRTVRSTDSLTAIQVARAPGVGTSFWTSDLTLSNPTDDPVTATLVFTPRGADGSLTYETATLDLPAGATRTVRDVLGSLFGQTTAAGSLELAPRALQAWVRTSTPAGGGSYGQGYPMVAADDTRVLSLDENPRIATGGVVRGTARTNLALAELWGIESTIRVRLLDRDGLELGATQRTLRPFENIQINDIVRDLAGGSAELAEGRVTLEVLSGDGRVAAALSIVDNDSDDPTTVVLEPF